MARAYKKIINIEKLMRGRKWLDAKRGRCLIKRNIDKKENVL